MRREGHGREGEGIDPPAPLARIGERAGKSPTAGSDGGAGEHAVDELAVGWWKLASGPPKEREPHRVTGVLGVGGASREPSDSAKLVPVDGSTAARAYRSSRLIVSNALLSLPPGRPIVRRLEGEGACPTIPPFAPFPHRPTWRISYMRASARARAHAPTPFPLPPFANRGGSPIVVVLTGPRASPSRVYIAAGASFLSCVSTPGD